MRTLDAFGKCILVGGISAALLASPGTAYARGYRVLYTFCSQKNCTDGGSPGGGFVRDAAGNIYGTTAQGGGVIDRGVVFKLTPDGTETVLYTFCSRNHCADGAYPNGVIEDSAGNLYGTTASGGTGCKINGGGGTVFRLAPDGTETVLYNFCSENNGGDGAFPAYGLIRDIAGNLYGTTEYGGADNYGVVFKLAPDGTETVLHAFTSGTSDGANPVWGVIEDKSGNLYGTTPYGGLATCLQVFLGCGVIFKIAPNGAETVLYRFGDADGAVPYAGLIMDKAGRFYGTTNEGGTGEEGVVYRFAADGKETVLYRFSRCTNGCGPFGELVRDGAGNLYGATQNGGTSNWGTVFRLAPDGSETVLHSFAAQDSPAGGLIKDNARNLYGTSYGTVFKLRK